MKKLLVPIVVFLLIGLYVLPVMADGWPQFAYDAANSGVVTAAAPVSEQEAELMFQVRVRAADSWDTLSNIVVLDDHVFVAVGSTLQKINSQGEVVGTYTFDMSISSSPFIAAADDLVFAFISDGSTGRVQAVKASTMAAAWSSEVVQDVESFSPITYYDDTLYLAVSGFDYGIWSATPGSVLGIAAGDTGADTDREFNLVYDAGLSYYWNGAAVSGDYLLLGSVEGIIQIVDRNSGDLLSEIDTGAGIKTSLTLTENSLYFGTSSGVGRVDINENQIIAESLVHLELGSQVTTTPVVYNGRIYVGTGDFSGGAGFFVVNDSDLTVAYKAEISGEDSFSGETIAVAGIQSTPVLTTAYGDDVYLYFSLNAKPSGIVALRDKAGQDEADYQTIFTPAEADQNATMAPFVIDENGTVYYTNDAGFLFAVARADEIDETGSTSESTETSDEIPQTGNSEFFSSIILIPGILALLTALMLLELSALKKHRRGKRR